LNFRNILVERQDPVLRITLNRPEVKNTFDLETRTELLDLIERIRDDESVKVVVLTGAGDAFSSGGDIRTFEGHEFTAVGGRMRLKRAHRVIRAMLELEKPIIGAVNGVAAGAGVSAALACDILIASEKARFVLTFVKIAVVPDLGNYYLLPLRVGVPKAKELMLTGDPIPAHEAERMGLVNRVVPHHRLHEESHELAARLAKGPSQSHAMIKAALNRWPASLETLLEMESAMQAVAFSSEDFKEGRQAFLEKRPPAFRGK
jgi:2-(1,2-epoxy-1,2-dihydrophenyl)acetyl-CoA isomerase